MFSCLGKNEIMSSEVWVGGKGTKAGNSLFQDVGATHLFWIVGCV